MRAMNRAFCAPVRSPWKDPAKPTGQDTVPLVTMRPEVGSIVPAIIFRSVDFPAPLRPRSPMERPDGSVIESRSATTNVRPPERKTLVRFCSRIIGA